MLQVTRSMGAKKMIIAKGDMAADESLVDMGTQE
jgi:hypothetical protein